jgi:hypothetical protein
MPPNHQNVEMFGTDAFTLMAQFTKGKATH